MQPRGSFCFARGDSHVSASDPGLGSLPRGSAPAKPRRLRSNIDGASLPQRAPDRTGGNPFCVGELAGHEDAGRRPQPQGVREVVAARVGRLVERARRLEAGAEGPALRPVPRSYSSPIGYVVANWKMYPGPAEAIGLFARVQQRLRREARSPLALPTVVVCPPAISLMAMRDIADRRLMRLGAQNCHWEPSGPYTGEISATMLKGLVDYVLVGHSERRRAGETDEQIARKVAAVAANAMTPILFVGEDEPTDAATEQTDERLERGLAEVDVARRPVLVVYEPTWAIGTDEPAAAEHVRRVVARLKERLRDKGAQRPMVIYGGTVTAENVTHFTAIDALDGVGSTRGTLDEDGFVTIVRRVAWAGSEEGAG